MAFVKDCPTNLAEIVNASKRLRCNNDTYGNNQYICVPNLEKTSLVEFCFDGIMGIHKENHCIAAAGKSLLEISCLNFSSGCPQEHHWSSDFYKYPACQNIRTQHHCYAMDPSCPQNMLVEDTDNHGTIDQMSIIVIVLSVLLALPTAGYLIYQIIKKKLARESSNELQTNDMKSTESPKEIKRNDKRSAESPKEIKRDDKKTANRLSDFISSLESVFSDKKAKEHSERDCDPFLNRKESPKEIKRDDKKTADRLSDFISSLESVFIDKKAKEHSERDCDPLLNRKESPKEIKRDDKKTAKSPKEIKRDDKKSAENLRNLQQTKED